MKIIITEKQERTIKSFILKEAMSDEFSFDTLKSLKTFKDRKNYCDKYLGFNVGSGSSRLVYQLDDEKVLKLAKNEKGIAQNEQEYYFGQDKFVDVTPHVFKEMCDLDNFTFIVSEYVLPAKEKDFMELYGINFNTFISVINTVGTWYGKRSYFGAQVLSDEEMEHLQDENPDIQEFVDYVSNYRPPIGDMLRLANYGMVMREGSPQIVLLDSGLSDEIYNKYYKKY